MDSWLEEARIGGVPTRLVFDNASGVGRRIGEKIRFADLFLRFKSHYDFDVTFCNPDSGNEKGKCRE
jgi:transposase